MDFWGIYWPDMALGRHPETTDLLISLGAPRECPVCLEGRRGGDLVYNLDFAHSPYLLCRGKMSIETILHPVCRDCSIRNKEFPEITGAEYIRRVFPE